MGNNLAIQIERRRIELEDRILKGATRSQLILLYQQKFGVGEGALEHDLKEVTRRQKASFAKTAVARRGSHLAKLGRIYARNWANGDMAEARKAIMDMAKLDGTLIERTAQTDREGNDIPGTRITIDARIASIEALFAAYLCRPDTEDGGNGRSMESSKSPAMVGDGK